MAPPKGFIPHNKKEIDLDLMKKLYFERLWDYKKIAKHFGFKSPSAIHDRFKKLGLKARDNTDLKLGFKFSKGSLKKMSEARKGKKRSKQFCENASKRVSGKKNPMYGKRAHNYKGGYINKSGYKIIYIDGMRFLEQRYVWMLKFGKITKGQEVHHINFNKLDNRIENLILMKKSEHIKLHNKRRKNKNAVS